MTTYDEIFPGQAPALSPAPIQPQQAGSGGATAAVAPLPQPAAKPRAVYRAPSSHGESGVWFFRFLLALALFLTAAFWFYPNQVRQAAQQFAIQYEQRTWEQNEGPPRATLPDTPMPVAQTKGAALAQRVLANKGQEKFSSLRPTKTLVITTAPLQPAARKALAPAVRAKTRSAIKTVQAAPVVAYSPGGDPIPLFSFASFQQNLAVHAQAHAQAEADRAMGIFEGSIATK